jgi:type III secretion protein Q
VDSEKNGNFYTIRPEVRQGFEQGFMEKLPLKKRSRKEVLLLNRIFTRNGGISFGLGRDIFDLVFLPVERQYPRGIALKIGAGENRFTVGLEKAFSMNLMDGFPGGENIIELPGEIREAVFEATLEELLDRFSAWSGSEPSILDADFESSAEDLGNNLFFDLIRQEDKRTFAGHISLDGAALEWFAALLENVPAVKTREWDLLPVSARFEIGATRLTLGDFKELEKHDIIFFDDCPFREEKKVVVRLSPTLSLKASLEETTIIVQGIMEDSMPDDDVQVEENLEDEEGDGAEEEDPGQGIEASSIDEIVIDLVFELGRKKIPIGDLKTIGPGYTFDLENDPEKPVSIRANGKIIGLGELMQVDDRVWVRVLDLFERSDV